MRSCVLKTDLQDLVVAIRGIEKFGRIKPAMNITSEAPHKPQTVGKAHVAELGYSDAHRHMERQFSKSSS